MKGDRHESADAQPGEIAAVVLHLASPEAAFLNGEDVKVDGGSSA